MIKLVQTCFYFQKCFKVQFLNSQFEIERLFKLIFFQIPNSTLPPKSMTTCKSYVRIQLLIQSKCFLMELGLVKFFHYLKNFGTMWFLNQRKLLFVAIQFFLIDAFVLESLSLQLTLGKK